MRYVYILQSLKFEGWRYVGVTSDLCKRVACHNSGGCRATKSGRPWRVETYIGFSDAGKAGAFEKYLKTGAGWAFSTKRF